MDKKEEYMYIRQEQLNIHDLFLYFFNIEFFLQKMEQCCAAWTKSISQCDTTFLLNENTYAIFCIS
jgi:hypothetical protein